MSSDITFHSEKALDLYTEFLRENARAKYEEWCQAHVNSSAPAHPETSTSDGKEKTRFGNMEVEIDKNSFEKKEPKYCSATLEFLMEDLQESNKRLVDSVYNLGKRVDTIDETLNTVIKIQTRHDQKLCELENAARGRVRDLEGRVSELEENRSYPFTPADKAKLDMLMVGNNLPPMTHNPIKPQPGSSAVDMTARPTTICQSGE